MTRLRRVVFLGFFSLVLLSFAGGCSDAVCEEAVSSMRACLAALDCSNADPLERTKCTSAKKRGEDAIQTMDGVPCVANASDLATQINQCHPNPATFCKCF